MDPNVTLQQLRAALAVLSDHEADQMDQDRAAYDAAEYAEDLDVWVTGGGFFPDSWMRNRN